MPQNSPAHDKQGAARPSTHHTAFIGVLALPPTPRPSPLPVPHTQGLSWPRDATLALGDSYSDGDENV